MAVVWSEAWASVFSKPTVYTSTAAGGGDAPITGYADVVAGENIEVVAGGGPAGENIVDAVNTADYTVAGGAFSPGAYDTRGLHYTFTMKVMASSLAEVNFQGIVILSAGTTLAWSIQQTRRFLEIQALETTPGNFEYTVDYRHPAIGGTTMAGATLTGGAHAADVWRDYEVIVTPSTITGTYVADGTLTGVTVASDGAVELKADGVTVVGASGLQFIVNHLSTTDPYKGLTIWHGYAGLAGPFFNNVLFTEVATTDPGDLSIPCCADTPGGGGDVGTNPDPVGLLPSWEASCTGGGAVDSVADLSDGELWL